MSMQQDSPGAALLIEIKGRDGRVLYTAQSAADVRAALEEAVRVGASLSGASLSGANLSGASLSGASLSGANLSGANLSGAYLRGANLRDANLSDANLSDAHLSGAYLSDANLSGASLSGAYLSGAYLSDANLIDANLSDASLSGAYLSDANLSGASLSGAYLSGAYLSGANLSGAYLSDANLSGASLSGANLRDAKNAELAIAQTRIIPDAGPIIGWKKCRDGRIVQLRIPAEAKRSHASGRKCRSDRARVLAIFNSDGTPTTEAVSLQDLNFRYVVGETVVPQVPFDDNPWNECASGIHWYITRLEAEAHF